MSKPNIQAIETAIALHRSGRNREADEIYRQILAKQPDNPVALHGLGILLHTSGASAAGLEYVQRAIARKPTEADYRNSQGVILSAMGHPAQAIESFERAIALRPAYPVALQNLANTLSMLGRWQQAVGVSQRLVQLAPRSPDAHCTLAGALLNCGRLDEATAACQKALSITPNNAQAWSNMGNIYSLRGMIDDAIAAYRKAVAAQPNYAGALSNLANALEQRGMIAEAAEAIQQAVRCDPNLADAQNNYGNILKDLAQLDESCEAYRRAIALSPQRSLFYSNLVYAMWFMQQCNPAEVLAESQAWARKLADPLTATSTPHLNDRSPDRKIRIGYVSNDFRQHPVGRLVFSMLVCRDRSQFDVVLFSGVPRPDSITQAIYQNANRVHATNGMTDQDLAQLVRREQIDILVDLTLHMAGTRMQMFAYKPAPVQITYLAYCATSGMRAMDYCISDPNLDPIPPGKEPTPENPGVESPVHSEKVLHLRQCYWCYAAPGEAPPANSLPALQNGFITFGSLNSFTKLNPGVINVWCQLLRQLPTSRLLMVVPGGPPRRTEVTAQFAAQGIDASRLTMVDIVSVPAYFGYYLNVDIALDPFPYNGGTTTMDSLYMGVPLITLAGRWATARAGVTILKNFGRPDWIAETPEQYIQIGVTLASDINQLAQLRRELRTQMTKSPLMDARRFTADFEHVYRAAWRYWCRSGSGAPIAS
jgi:predicted O-linked N-acetylglucosamine transferase (SPINDLY family)